MIFVKEGHSKKIHYLGRGIVQIELKPSVYSYTYNRCGLVEGSDILRYESCKILCKELKKNSIDHSYLIYEDGLILSKLVLEDGFEPNDISAKEKMDLPKFAPIEVVVKTEHVGTPDHRYYEIGKYPTRFGYKIESKSKYPKPFVRFDWRNPNEDHEGKRLCDEVMSESFADYYINVENAKNTALKAFDVLSKFLESKKIQLIDICFFIDQNGTCIFSEISPDCMRVKSLENKESLDKDIWRAGGSSPLLIQKWTKFLEMIS